MCNFGPFPDPGRDERGRVESILLKNTHLIKVFSWESYKKVNEICTVLLKWAIEIHQNKFFWQLSLKDFYKGSLF